MSRHIYLLTWNADGRYVSNAYADARSLVEGLEDFDIPYALTIADEVDASAGEPVEVDDGWTTYYAARVSVYDHDEAVRACVAAARRKLKQQEDA